MGESWWILTKCAKSHDALPVNLCKDLGNFLKSRFGEFFCGDLESPEGDGAVVALDENEVFGCKSLPLGCSGRAVQGDIAMHFLAIHDDGKKHRFFSELSGIVKAGCAEFDDEFLPLARWLGGVGFRSMAFEAFGVPVVVPALVNSSHVALSGLGFSVAVENLDFVAALKVDSRVGSFRDHEFGFHRAISILLVRLEVTRFSRIGGVGENLGRMAVRDGEVFICCCDSLGCLPMVPLFEDGLPGIGL